MSYAALQMKRRLVADKVIVGIDPAKKKHQATVIDTHGIQLGESFTFQHSYEGFTGTLWKKLSEIDVPTDPKSLIFAIESSCNLWQCLSAYLKQRGFTVLLVSPLTTHHSRSFLNHDFSKTDPKDALLMANSARDGYYDVHKTFSAQSQDLHRLSLIYHKLRKNLVQNKTRLRSQVELIFPEFCRVMNPSTATARHLLSQYFLPRHYLDLDIEKMSPEISRLSHQNYGTEALHQLSTLAQTSIGISVDDGYEIGIRHAIQCWILQINQLETLMDEVMAKMSYLAQQTPYFGILTSLKGISTKLASLFIAETRELSEFDHYKKLEKFAGLNLRQSQSGDYIGRRHISHIGNRRLIWVIYKMTEETAKYVPEVRCKFLRRQIKKRSYRKNIIASSSTLLKLIVAMIKQNRVYEPSVDAIKAVEVLEQKYNEITKKHKVKTAA
jgi:transposase